MWRGAGSAADPAFSLRQNYAVCCRGLTADCPDHVGDTPRTAGHGDTLTDRWPYSRFLVAPPPRCPSGDLARSHRITKARWRTTGRAIVAKHEGSLVRTSPFGGCSRRGPALVRWMTKLAPFPHAAPPARSSRRSFGGRCELQPAATRIKHVCRDTSPCERARSPSPGRCAPAPFPDVREKFSALPASYAAGCQRASTLIRAQFPPNQPLA
jgi:hypothetical protein